VEEASPAAAALCGRVTVMVNQLRRSFLVVMPLTVAVVLWWHPAGGEHVYDGVRDDVDAWLFVHVVFLFSVPLLGIATLLLLKGIHGLAATVSRTSLIFFLVFYTAYEVTVGVGTAILVDYTNGLPPAEQEVLAGAIQEYNRNVLVSDPSISMVLGALGWVVAMVAAAVALRGAGAGWPTTLLMGFASLFAIHPPPIGPAGLACLAAASVAIERNRTSHGKGFPAPPRPRAEPAAPAPVR
jgi:hypothetical protein